MGAHWNHRAMRTVHESGEVSYSIREVFYDADGSINGWTADPMDPHGETPDELRSDLERMLACLDKPVLDEAEELARCEARNPQTGPDRIRHAIAIDRGGDAPTQPFVVCDRSEPSR